MITLLWRWGKRGGGREKVDRNSSLCWGWFNYKLYIIFLKNSLISFKVNKKCVGDFPHKLFVCFGKANPHGFVLNRHEFPPQVRPIFEKPLDSVPHRGSGTLCLCPRAYKACVGCISCRCGTESKGFPKMGRT